MVGDISDQSKSRLAFCSKSCPKFLGKLRNFYFFFKQSAIGIRKGFQIVFQILTALLRWRIQHFKEVTQGSAHILSFIA